MIKPKVFDRLALRMLSKVFSGQTKEIQYTQPAGGKTYDPATDAMVGGTDVTITVPNSVWLKPTIQEEDPSKSATGSYRESEVEKESWIVLVAKLQLKNGATQLTPTENDVIVTADSREWNIVSIDTPPGESIYKLKVVRND